MADGRAGMNVCVLGLWHLGTVTAACLAAARHEVIGLDFDATAVEALATGKPPIFEPGLEDLIGRGVGAGGCASRPTRRQRSLLPTSSG